MHIEKIIEDMQISKEQHNMVATTYGYDHMVYVRLFEGCNLHCEHCFIPNNPKKIQASFYENQGLTNELLKYVNLKEGNKIYLQWHGGEPTLLGVDYLTNAIENVIADNRFKYMNGIQTNLMNFHIETEKWVSLYQKYFDGHIGVSWDFGIRHTKSSNIQSEKTNTEFENIFWNNLKLAKKSGLEIYMVITATKLLFQRYAKNPLELFDKLIENGITKINFERITKTGYARETWDKLGLSNEEYSKYMSKFFKAYILFKTNNPEVDFNVSPFDGLLRSVIGLNLNKIKDLQINNVDKKQADVWDLMSFKNQGYGCWSGECDTKFHTIDSNGYKHGCTALTSEQDNKNKSIINNVNVQKIIWIGKKDVALSQKENILEQRNIRKQTCVGCEFISICSSGCLSVEKFDESGECSGAKGLFTTMNQLIQKKLEIKEKTTECS